MKKRNAKHFKGVSQKHASYFLNQPPELGPVPGGSDGVPELLIEHGVVMGVRTPGPFRFCGLPVAGGPADRLAVQRTQARRNRAERRLLRAVRMAARREGAQEAAPRDALTEESQCHEGCGGRFFPALDTDKVLQSQKEMRAEGERLAQARPAAFPDEAEGDETTILPAIGRYRRPLSDAAYNARLIEFSERKHDLLAVLLLVRVVGRMCGPCTIRALLLEAGVGEAGFMSTIWLIAAGRLVPLTPGRLSLSTFVEPSRPRRVARAMVPTPMLPAQWEARA